jgi:hypothetical protein
MKLKMKMKVLLASLVLILMSLSAHAADKVAGDTKPMVLDVALLTVDAVVESIDRQTRQVTLKDAKGESTTFTLDEGAGRLDDIETGDQVTIEYLESVAIQVFESGVIEAGAVAGGVALESLPGEKPAALIAKQVSVVVTIEAIDLEKNLVTLKGKNGKLKTVTPRDPENLKKVKVGDMVKITFTEAVGFSVTEKPAAK